MTEPMYQQSTAGGCPTCPTRAECACPEGAERCPDNDDCPCDKTVCPCAKHARRPPEPPCWRRPVVIGLTAAAVAVLAAIAALTLLAGDDGGDDVASVDTTDETDESESETERPDPEAQDPESEAEVDEPETEVDEPTVELDDLASTFDGDAILTDLGISDNPFGSRDCIQRPGTVDQVGATPLEPVPEFGTVCSAWVDVQSGIPADRYLLVVAEIDPFVAPPGTTITPQIGIGLDLGEGGPPAASESEGVSGVPGTDVVAFGGGERGWEPMDAFTNGDFAPTPMAGFSSRGPSSFGIAVKPDVTAPGVSIMAFGRSTPDGQAASEADAAALNHLVLGPVCDGCGPPDPGLFTVELVRPDGGTVPGVEVEPGLFGFEEELGRITMLDACGPLASLYISIGALPAPDHEIVVTHTSNVASLTVTDDDPVLTEAILDTNVFAACD